MKTNEERQFDKWKEENNCYYDLCRGWHGDICECSTEKLRKAVTLYGAAIQSVINSRTENCDDANNTEIK